MANSRKRVEGFSLIELLVIICIMSTFLGTFMPLLFGSSRDSALTAKCKNNMRSLAQGVIVCAQANGEYGHFPAAGMYRSIDWKSRKKSYYPHRPWVSNVGDVSVLNHSTGSVELGKVAHFTESDLAVQTAITNGAIWRGVGETFDAYRCPAHVKAYRKANNGRKPGWSYMMNQEFGYNWNNGNAVSFCGASPQSPIMVATGTSGLRKDGTAQRGHDKVLLFAEIQGVDIDDSGHGVDLKAIVSGSGLETDAVLEYTKEDMGFNHRIGMQKWGGNVAFADGHVDTIVMPTGMSRRDLTRYLCQGYDVPHDGSAYTPDPLDR